MIRFTPALLLLLLLPILFWPPSLYLIDMKYLTDFDINSL